MAIGISYSEMLQDGKTGEAGLYPKLRVAQREYSVGWWREKEKLTVRLMPKSDECSKCTKWAKPGALLCDHEPSQGQKDVLMFDSLLVSCHGESSSHTASAVYHTTPAVRNHITKIMEGKKHWHEYFRLSVPVMKSCFRYSIKSL